MTKSLTPREDTVRGGASYEPEEGPLHGVAFDPGLSTFKTVSNSHVCDLFFLIKQLKFLKA